ncbi:MAG: hypothetical protein ACNI3C_02650 [Candidatus Marinarcus sp.]|uniref:hypothetical protein n=1 Tax=Candidatus Marinarcus sp. TaxID=3100987 RepID=UPI003AFF8995
MLEFQKGAIDKILVTLLLIIVGVGIVFIFNTWITNDTTDLMVPPTSKITAVPNDTPGN